MTPLEPYWWRRDLDVRQDKTRQILKKREKKRKRKKRKREEVEEEKEEKEKDYPCLQIIYN